MREVIFTHRASRPWRQADTLSLSQTQWLAVLELSVMWNFVNIRNTVITAINITDATERLRAALKYDIKSWVPSALQELVAQDKPIGMLQVESLGVEFAMRLVDLRERVRAGGTEHHHWKNYCAAFAPQVFPELVQPERHRFWDDL